MLKAGIYDPYLDSLGGGERYCLTVAETLLKNGYQVDIFWSGSRDLIKTAKDRFNLEIDNLNIVPDIFNVLPWKIECLEDTEKLTKVVSHPHPRTHIHRLKHLLTKIKTTRNYDLIFYICDWSLPLLFSKNNLLHVQVPLKTSASSKEKFLNLFKLLTINKIICNSQFTLNFAKNYFGSKCLTLYPPIDIDKFEHSSNRDNVILSVGRFDDILNIKKQDVMIEAFKKFHQQNLGDWKLVLAGASLETPEKNKFLQHLKNLSDKFPVEFIVNPSFEKLKSLYSRSKFYWHAAGFGVDEFNHPEHTEHFGMAPVEAMASGCIPVVVAKGGLPEIVRDNFNGYLWDNIDTLISKTQLLAASPDLCTTLSQNAVETSRQFSKDTFVNEFKKYI